MKAGRKGSCDVAILSVTGLLLPALTERPNSTENGLVENDFLGLCDTNIPGSESKVAGTVNALTHNRDS